MAKFLINHWRDVDKDRWDLTEGEQSVEGKVPESQQVNNVFPSFDHCHSLTHSIITHVRLLFHLKLALFYR